MLKLIYRMGFVMVLGNCYKFYIIVYLFIFRVREDLEGGIWGYLFFVFGIYFVVYLCSIFFY